MYESYIIYPTIGEPEVKNIANYSCKKKHSIEEYMIILVIKQMYILTCRNRISIESKRGHKKKACKEFYKYVIYTSRGSC